MTSTSDNSPTEEANKNNLKFQQALALIERLRNEDFNKITEEKLASHPYLQAAAADTLTLAQKQAFAYEQFAIQHSDAISFAYLAGHRGFQPISLASPDLVVPVDPKVVYPKNGDYPDLFQFMLGGEVYASSLLLDHARHLGMDGEDAIWLKSNGKLSPLAQAYASYWSRLALSSHRAAGAAACAVNFPAWGRMCQQLLVALQASNKELEKEEVDKALAFVQFFASPIDSLDEMAASIIMQEIGDDDDSNNFSYDDIATHVRLLQGCELMFWDACHSATGEHCPVKIV